MTFPLSPLPINRCLLFEKNTMKYNSFEFKLCSNLLCTSCPSDSLRERARSERLHNLSERLRWVRGPRVRRSHILPLSTSILAIPPQIPLPFTPITTPPTQLQLLRPISSSRTIHKACDLHPGGRQLTSVRGSIVLVPLLLYHS